MKIKFSPFALTDLEESVTYYNLQQENLGVEFAEKVNLTSERIKQNPLQFPKEYKTIRKAITQKFPFNIFYAVKDDIAYILGVFHANRNPRTMTDRYKSI